MDPGDLQVDRFVNLVYYWAIKDWDEESRKKFDERLNTEPASTPEEALAKMALRPEWSDEAAFASFPIANAGRRG